MIDRPRAISLSRPWTELVVAGIKPIENRSWRPAHRGLLVIHAAKSLDDYATLVALDAGDPAAVDLLDRNPTPPTGYIGVVDLIGICSASRHTATVSCDCGPWAFAGSHHWRLAQARRFTDPIPARGMPGIWRVINPEVDAAIALSTPLPT